MDNIIPTLIEGYKQFKPKYFEQSQYFRRLVNEGQRPKVLMIACCDSRVDPAIIVDAEPGELFVVRNVANLVPPFNSDPRHHGTSAALEFAVKNLGVQHIILFGHKYCGGIRALMEAECDSHPTDFIKAWMNIADAAKQRVLQRYPHADIDEQAHHCEKESLLISLVNLQTFPWIKEQLDAKKLFLHAWYFDLDSGMVESYHESQQAFVPLDNNTID